MSDSRLDILRRVEEGKAGVDEAERRLAAPGGPARLLRCTVRRIGAGIDEADRVNVRIPLPFAALWPKIAALLPTGAMEALNRALAEAGIDLGSTPARRLAGTALKRRMQVTTESFRVCIFCE